MKAILLTCSPYECYKLLTGDLSILVRKVKPKCDLPIDVYISCGKEEYPEVTLYSQENEFGGYMEHTGNGKVVAKFTLNKVEEIICRPICGEWECYTETLGYSEIAKASCLENRKIVHYLKVKNGYAWHIDNLKVFDKPRELSEFEIYCSPKKKCCKCKYVYKYACGQIACDKPKLTKASARWCYVEV